MAKPLDEKTLAVWMALRSELRLLRGQNLWRGQEVMLLGQGRMRLLQERRGKQPAPRTYEIHLTPDFESLWAEEIPGKRKISVAADHGGDWRAWLQAIVAECRGAAYMVTNSSSADYRKGL